MTKRKGFKFVVWKAMPFRGELNGTRKALFCVGGAYEHAVSVDIGYGQLIICGCIIVIFTA